MSTGVYNGVGDISHMHLAHALVAGPDGPDNRARIHGTPGPRWFAEDRPIRRVHGDASMFVGGLRALLLQSLHPLAMAGVAASIAGYSLLFWGLMRLDLKDTSICVMLTWILVSMANYMAYRAEGMMKF